MKTHLLLSLLVLSTGMAAQSVSDVPSRPAPLTLETLEAMALQHNPTLDEAKAVVRARAGQVRQAGAWPNPTVGYAANRLRGGYVRGGDQGVFLQQSILLGGKLAAARATAQVAQARAEMEATAQRATVLTAVRLAYYHSLAAQERVQVEEQLATLAADAATTTHQLGNVGQADLPDELQAEVEAGQAQLREQQAQQERQQAWQALAAVVGQPELPLQTLASSLSQDLPVLQPAAYLQQLLTQSPAVQVAEIERRQAEARLHQQKRQAVPDLFLRAGIAQDRELSDFSRKPSGMQGSAEIGVQLPLFNRNQGNIASASAELERSTLDLDRVRLQLRAQAAPWLAGYALAQQSVRQYRESLLPKAERAWRLYQTSYQNMGAAYPQVLIAQRTWFQLQSDYLRQLEAVWVDASALKGFLATDGLTLLSSPGSGARPGAAPGAGMSGQGGVQ
ncbi:MAG: TolC family protein [Terriglobales bacterium]